MRLSSTVASLCLIILTACGGGSSQQAAAPPASTPPADTSASTPPPAASNPGSEPFAPMSSRGTPVTAAPGASAATNAGILWNLPEGWQEQAPSSSMRMAQAAIPGSGGAGELTVFFFGPGGGGGVEANLQRWVGQIEAPQGAQPQHGSFEVDGGFRVTWVEAAGTLKASQMGTGPTTDQPGYRLLGAVVEGEGGPWFFKATGPDATLTAQRDAFMGMLRSIRRTNGVV